MSHRSALRLSAALLTSALVLTAALTPRRAPAQSALPLTACLRFDAAPVPGGSLALSYPSRDTLEAVADAQGCVSLMLPVVAGREEALPLPAFGLRALFPNPTGGGRPLRLRFEGDVERLSLYDALGRRRAHLVPVTGSARLNDLPAGIYFLRASDALGHTDTASFLHLGGPLPLRITGTTARTAAGRSSRPAAKYGAAGAFTVHVSASAQGYAPFDEDLDFSPADTLIVPLSKIVELSFRDLISNDPATPPDYSPYEDSLVVVSFDRSGNPFDSSLVTDGEYRLLSPVKEFFLSVTGPGGRGYVRDIITNTDRSREGIASYMQRNGFFGGNSKIVDQRLVSDLFFVVNSFVPGNHNFVGGVSSGQVDFLSIINDGVPLDSLYVLVVPVDSLEAGRDISLGRDLGSARGVINFYLNQRRFDGMVPRFKPVITNGVTDDTLRFYYGVHKYFSGYNAPQWPASGLDNFFEFINSHNSWTNIIKNALVNPMTPVIKYSEDWGSTFFSGNAFVTAYDPESALTVGTAYNDELGADGKPFLYSFGVIDGARGGVITYILFNDGFKFASPGTDRQGALTKRLENINGEDSLGLAPAGSAILNVFGVLPNAFVISSDPNPPNKMYGKADYQSMFSSHGWSRSDNGLLVPRKVTHDTNEGFVNNRPYIDGLNNSSGLYERR